ncbi:hypothetical protein EV426DRAFT_703928 [Tirmania nivea]|nr:hypothetical protein EV426DRAFT_703928 [Tirmania nivea]
MSDNEPVATRRHHRNSPSSTPLAERQRTAKQRQTTARILPTVNEFEEYPSYSPYSLWPFDWLHVCILGMVKTHLMNWITHYLDKYDVTDQWEVFLQRAPQYLELTILNKRYSHVQQWQSKDIRQLIHYLLASLAPLLKPMNERRHPGMYLRVLLTTRRLLEVVILAQQRYHTETSLSSIDNALTEFHNLKDVFLPAHE